MNISFNRFLFIVFVSLITVYTSSCRLKKRDKSENASVDSAAVDEEWMKALMEALQNSDTTAAEAPASNRLEKTYNPAATRVNDLLHTRIEISFDIPKMQLFGKATLDFKPYWYATDSLILDAKSFDMHRIALVDKNGAMSDLKYTYANDVLKIKLDRSYTRNEQYKVYVQYTANPERVKAMGSAAITDAKGLYFIDPKDEDPLKPTQIWTQGETESSSCWFPTIDKPNEKMTQELIITVPEKFRTLSNGMMVSTKKNTDGTRTDTWKMDLPHAPYLAMMAIGEYAVVKDKWRKLDVDYYVEPEYEPYARKIFGNTPEMMEFFSKKLGVDYPWPKYSQVVVRDYVSGAMENTSATIFGEFVQQKPEEMLDQSYESVIAHELFHHWFGDLVTCESWANLPLNESFANYSEYLWDEYKYGRDAADFHLQEQRNEYFEESFSKKVNLIRFDYENREDMFDRHSYQKGGCVLHMLRKYVGDEAFFEALKLYLTDNKFQPAEIHHLRLAFEKVTGEDLNWFFDQWFLGKGHPTLQANWVWLEESKAVELNLSQLQDITENDAFKLPLDVDIYTRGDVKRVRVQMDQVLQTIYIPCAERPDFVNVDAERMLLGSIGQINNRKDAEWLLLNGKLYEDRYQAIEKIIDSLDAPGTSELMKTSMRDKFWNIRLYAINSSEALIRQSPDEFKSLLFQIAAKDPKAAVRAAAYGIIGSVYKGDEADALMRSGLNDSSLTVKSYALQSMYGANPEKTLEYIEQNEKTVQGLMLVSFAAIYADAATKNKANFFTSAYSRCKTPSEKYYMIQMAGRYFLGQGEEVINQNTAFMTELASKAPEWYLRLASIQVLSQFMEYFQGETEMLDYEITELSSKANSSELQDKQARKLALSQNLAQLQIILDAIRTNETDPNLLPYLNPMPAED